MSKFRTEYDPVTGYTKEYYYDDMTGRLTVNKKMDVSAVIDMCRRQEATTHKKSRLFSRETGFGHKVASVPNVIIAEIAKKYNVNPYSSDPEEAKRFYRIIAQDYPYLKTTRAKGVL